MPHSVQSATALLDEYLAKRKAIIRYKPRVRGPRVLSIRPDLLVKAEFQPDNSRIGCNSRCLQSVPLARSRYAVLHCQNTETVARVIVEDWLDARRGLVPLTAVVTQEN